MLASVITHLLLEEKMTILGSQKVWKKAYEKVDTERSWVLRDIAFPNVLRKYVRRSFRVLDVGCARYFGSPVNICRYEK